MRKRNCVGNTGELKRKYLAATCFPSTIKSGFSLAANHARILATGIYGGTKTAVGGGGKGRRKEDILGREEKRVTRQRLHVEVCRPGKNKEENKGKQNGERSKKEDGKTNTKRWKKES